MYSLIKEQFYFKSKELFSAKVSIFDPYKLSEPVTWFSPSVVYSALISEDEDNDMEGLVTYQLRNMKSGDIVKVRIGD